MKEIYEHLDDIVMKDAEGPLIPGCLVLEGGAFRGLYSMGVTDVLMEHELHFQTVIGVSAGALTGINYVAKQIGRAARINLEYRHDSRYVGAGAMLKDHGITGFSFVFHEADEQYPLNMEEFNNPERRFVACATNIETGRQEYLERDNVSDMFKAVQASATVPYISEAVELDGKRYLDGGIAGKIPYQWAIDEGYDKIVVIRTRDPEYRKTSNPPITLIDREYGRYPEFRQKLLNERPEYNLSLQRLETLENQGRLFVIAPSEEVTISRFESDLDALAQLYYLGRKDAQTQMEKLQAYLKH